MHPERMNKLILWLPSMNADRLRSDPVIRAIIPLAFRDWDTYLLTLSHAVVGGWDPSRAAYADAFADLARGGITQREFPRFVEAMRGHDISGDVGKIKAPTLVLTREDANVYTVDVVREVAAAIPDAELVCPPGNWLLPCTGDDITREIARFMGNHRAANGHDASDKTEFAPPLNGHNLSPREREVLRLVARGKTNGEIAEELVISHATAARHVHNILNKLEMNRRAEIAVYAAMTGLSAH
jgi:DNA-binding CsgD family transcriptional regulator